MSPSRDDRLDQGTRGATRVPALVLTAAVTAAVCVLATWPRWHPAAATTAAAVAAVPAQTPALSVSGPLPVAATGPMPGAVPAPLPGNAPVGMMRGGQPALPAVASPVAPLSSAPAPNMPPATRPARLIVEVPDTVVSWRHLDEMQRIALAPFASEWERFSVPQQRKWLAIASVYPRMSPEAQQRLHARMLRWTQMTPDERRVARENYEMSRVLPPNARQQAWHAYLALPDAQKEKLAAAERSHHRPLVVSAPPGGNTAPRPRHPAPPRMAAHAASDTPAIAPVPPPGVTDGAGAGAPATISATAPALRGASPRHAGAAAPAAGGPDDGEPFRP
ncbi:MAG: DUF3106 domain-containing protein [Janthinobacterium lividum]